MIWLEVHRTSRAKCKAARLGTSDRKKLRSLPAGVTTYARHVYRRHQGTDVLRPLSLASFCAGLIGSSFRQPSGPGAALRSFSSSMSLCYYLGGTNDPIRARAWKNPDEAFRPCEMPIS